MKNLFLGILTLICLPAFAANKCDPDRAKSVQIMQDGRAFLKDSGGTRHFLGDVKTPATMALTQLAMSAVGKDVYIGVAYADGVSCEKPNNTQVLWLDVQYAKTDEQNF